MKYKLYLRIMLFLNIICISAAVVTLIPFVKIDKSLASYYDKAMNIIYDNCKDGEYYEPSQIEVKIAKLETEKNKNELHAIGWCIRFINRYTVEIDKHYWDEATEQERILLMFHEVAHCALGIEHSKDSTNYMYPSTNYVSVQDTINQFTNDVLVTCSKGRRRE